MILDRENHVAAALAYAGTGNLLATDVIDLQAARDIGSGSDLYWYHTLNTAAAAGGTSIEFQIITGDLAAMTSGETVVATSGPIALAQLPLNFLLFQSVPRRANFLKYGRYVTARLVRVGTFTGAGTWNSGITYDVTDYRQFYNAPFFT